MQKRYVFVDASIFYSLRYDFRHRHLMKLKEMVTEGTISLLMPEITKREVRRHLEREWSQKFTGSISKASTVLSDLAWLHEQPFVALSVDQDSIKKKLVGSFEGFLEETRAETVSSDVSLGTILDQYFSASPPFGEGRKNKEFPDAIIIEGLRKWASEKAVEEIYVVTSDADFQDVGLPFSVFKNLESFLDDMLSEQTFISEAKEFLRRHPEEVIEKLKKAFSEIEFYVPEYQEGIVRNCEIESMALREVSVIDYDLEVAGLDFEVGVDVTFRAQVEHEDYATASWDSEDKKYYFHTRVDEVWPLEERMGFFLSAIWIRDEAISLLEIDVVEPIERVVSLHEPNEVDS